MQPRPKFVYFVAAIWAALYAASFLLPWNMPPTGDSFVRGANRLFLFLQLQGAAALLGVLLWIQGRQFSAHSWPRLLSRLPALLALVLFLGIAAVVGWAVLSKPPVTSQPALTPTAPITE